MLVGAKDQKHFGGLLVRHFEETRGDEFSVDRLGRSGIDGSVVKFLRPLADAAGRTFHPGKLFNGWAVLQADKLEKSIKGTPLPAVASPSKDNPYHAHVDTQRMFESEPERHYHIAVCLKELFTSKGKVRPIADQAKNEGIVRYVPLKLRRWLSERFNIWIILQ